MKKFVLKPLSEEGAKEVCNWRYENEYSIYNFSDWDIVVKNGWGLSIKEKREKEFVSILLNDELIAYGRISSKENKVLIGIGLKPDLCGKGYGKGIMNLLIEECMKRYINYTIILEVRSFNKRAINCYRKVGFEVKDKYVKKTFNGEIDEFCYMEYTK